MWIVFSRKNKSLIFLTFLWFVDILMMFIDIFFSMIETVKTDAFESTTSDITMDLSDLFVNVIRNTDSTTEENLSSEKIILTQEQLDGVLEKARSIQHLTPKSARKLVTILNDNKIHRVSFERLVSLDEETAQELAKFE